MPVLLVPASIVTCVHVVVGTEWEPVKRTACRQRVVHLVLSHSVREQILAIMQIRPAWAGCPWQLGWQTGHTKA